MLTTFNYHCYIDKTSNDSGNMYEIFEKCCEIFKQAIVCNINQLVVTKTLKNVYLKKCVAKKKKERVYSSNAEYVWLL